VAAQQALGVMPTLDCAASVEEAVADADAVVLVTEWPEFLALDWSEIARAMRGTVVIDGRNALDADAVRAAGLRYEGIGLG
jgi:UDPglucose 6-dehydrogenase